MHRFKTAILLYLNSMERKNLMKLKKDTIVLLSYQVNEAFYRLVRDEKLGEVSVSYFFVRRIPPMLSRISSEPLMSMS